MRFDTLKYLSLSIILCLTGCSPGKRPELPANNNIETSSLKYAKRFSIHKKEEVTFVALFGNRANRDTSNLYILSKDTSGLKRRFPNARIMQIPCKKIAALSSIYAAMLCELGEIENIAAIDNIDYVNNRQIIDRYKKGQLKELQRTPDLDIEQTIVLRPDIVFTFGMGYDAGDNNNKLKQLKIPLAVSVDHLEESPLARAEWIKFFAAFVDKSFAADSIFSGVEKNYTQLREIAKNTKGRPTVFSETKYGDIWYMPGGKSYMATLLEDAAASYLWNDNSEVGSLPLSFEQVYAKAKLGDFWINLPLVKSKKELISFESRYAQFKAFQEDKIYNNTKVTNDKGYSTYWETGMMYPDRILSDLVQIFHPEIDAKKEFHYYQQLK